MNNPHEHCGAAWRHLRESLIEILGDRLPENPRGHSDADIRNAVRRLVVLSEATQAYFDKDSHDLGQADHDRVCAALDA